MIVYQVVVQDTSNLSNGETVEDCGLFLLESTAYNVLSNERDKWGDEEVKVVVKRVFVDESKVE